MQKAIIETKQKFKKKRKSQEMPDFKRRLSAFTKLGKNPGFFYYLGQI